MPRIKKPKKSKRTNPSSDEGFVRWQQKSVSGYIPQRQTDIRVPEAVSYSGNGQQYPRQNEITMAAANAIKSKRIIELTSGEAGIVNHTDKIYLLDWMQTYLEYQEKRDKKGIGQIKAVTHILKEYAGKDLYWIGLTSLFAKAISTTC